MKFYIGMHKISDDLDEDVKRRGYGRLKDQAFKYMLWIISIALVVVIHAFLWYLILSESSHAPRLKDESIPNNYIAVAESAPLSLRHYDGMTDQHAHETGAASAVDKLRDEVMKFQGKVTSIAACDVADCPSYGQVALTIRFTNGSRFTIADTEFLCDITLKDGTSLYRRELELGKAFELAPGETTGWVAHIKLPEKYATGEYGLTPAVIDDLVLRFGKSINLRFEDRIIGVNFWSKVFRNTYYESDVPVEGIAWQTLTNEAAFELLKGVGLE